MLFIGIDWAELRHRVVLVGDDGAVLDRVWIEHSTLGFEAFAGLLSGWGVPMDQIHIAIELHDSVLLDRLLRLGCRIYGLNPKSAERIRERHTPNGVKNDDRDAWSLAEFVRTGGPQLRPLVADSDQTRALQEWVALREDLVQERTKQVQRLRDHLVRWHPQILAAIEDLQSDWSLALLERYPSADRFAGRPAGEITDWTRGRRMHRQTRDRVAQAAAWASPTCCPARNGAHEAEVRHRVEAIRAVRTEIEAIDKTLAELVEQHPDAEIFKSLPNAGVCSVAAMLAGFGENRARWTSCAEVAARWGVAPVTVQSGKSCVVRRRVACNTTLHQSWVWYAFNSVRKAGCWAREDYRSKRAGGMTHYTALRSIAERWVKIAYRCWQNRTPYDETVHQQNRAARSKPQEKK